MRTSARGQQLLSTLLLAVSVLWSFATGTARAEWVARPGTVKLFAKKAVVSPGSDRRPATPSELFQRLGAEVVDEQDAYVVAQLPISNASAAPTILRDFAEVVEVLEDFDLLHFADLPLDARRPPPVYPAEWYRSEPLRSPGRDAFVLQFASIPRVTWVTTLRDAGVTVLEYLPQNGFLVLADERVLGRLKASLPIQLLRLHQPFHKASPSARGAADNFTDVLVTIANVPEAAEAIGLLAERTLSRLGAPQDAGDRTLYPVTLDTLAIRQLAALPAVIAIELRGTPTLSGQRESHLTLGDTLVSNVGGLLRPVQTDHRTWINSKGVGNYKTALRAAILDAGLDTGGGANVHADFRNAAGANFVEVVPYTNTVQGSNADCYGHATMVASVLAGNAADPDGPGPLGPPADIGNPPAGDGGGFFLGRGVTPELSLVAGRIWNQHNTQAGLPVFDPRDWRLIYGDLYNRGVRIAINSWNFSTIPEYSGESRTQDQAVRSANGVVGGPQMAIYFSAGNNENNINRPLVSAPATGKNVTAVGGSENYNLSTYAEPAQFVPTATCCAFADNGNHFWTVSQQGPTQGDQRIKPDVVAPASAIEGARTREPGANCRTDTPYNFAVQVGGVIDPASAVDYRHFWSRGTSFSAPLAAGAGALLYTWFQNVSPGTAPTPALLKAMQITFAEHLPGAPPGLPMPPEATQGWGRSSLARAFATDGRYVWHNEGMLLTQGQTAYLPVAPGAVYRIRDASRPVRVTLVWTDAPGPSTTMPGFALVNNLDLTVRMSSNGSGRYAIGNNFNPATGRSNILTGLPPAQNNRDNVEQVIFTNADVGTDQFSVEVFGRTIAGDALDVWSVPASTNFRQNFALFIDNATQMQNNAAYPSQSPPPATVQAGMPYTANFTMQNTGSTTWVEGPAYFYRLGSITPKSAFDLDGRAFLSAGQTIAPTQSKTFTISGTAPYAAGTYPLQWQMVEELVHFFGAATPLTNVTVTPRGYSFYTLTPCRVLDTRNPAGQYGAPALQPSLPRLFVLRGQCGIPTTATAVSVNMTAVNPSGTGHLIAYPANIVTPLVSTLNYRGGLTRSNNAILTVDALGQIEVATALVTDFILDVNGYFQ